MSVHFLRSLSVLGLSALLWGAVPPESPVADAAMRADLDKVRLLLKGGADVNVAQGDGMTALHWSAENRSAEMAAMLIYAGANMEAVTRIGGYTPLHLASRSGSALIVQELLEAGANPAVRSSAGGATPLHFAASASSKGTVISLLDHGAKIDARESAWEQTPLMFAASLGRTDIVELLLSRGADISVTTSTVYLPALQDADRAARQRRDKVLDGFRAQHVSGSESWRPSPTEVQAAMESSRIDPDELADPEEEDEDEDAYNEQIGVPGGNSYADLVGTMGGATALIHAVREGHVETVEVLLDHGADINQPSTGDKTTPLLSATINGHFDLALELLKRGADPRLASTGGTTPLFAAVNTRWAPKARYPQQEAHKQQQATHLELMEALLRSGANPNARLTKHLWFMEYTFSHLGIDASGATPFWRATHALDVPAMKLLVEYGADPGIPTTKGQDRRSRGGGTEDASGLPPVPFGGPAVYPIHVAAGHGYGTGYAGYSHRHAPDAWLTTVTYLVEKHGADVNARDHNGYSPIHNAASRGDTDMIRYLVDKGADVMVVSRRGQTTVDMANGPQQRIQPFPEAMSLLESLGAKNNHNCVSC